MVSSERRRADVALLLATPVADENRAPRMRVGRLQNAHRLEHRDRSRSVVGGAAARVPRIEVRRQHHIFVRHSAVEARDRIEHR